MDKDLKILELEEIIVDLRGYIIALEEKLDTLIYKLNIGEIEE